MRKTNALLLTAVLAVCCVSCAAKYGCPSNGKNVGAERLLSGEKPPKVRKMKV